MEPKKLANHRKGPERVIQDAIMKKLKQLDWSVRETHGNMFQWGFPDIYAAHRSYGSRWIEVKDPNRRGDVFTRAQHEYFFELSSKNIGVWVLTSDSDSEIKKLFAPPNWTHYLQVMNM